MKGLETYLGRSNGIDQNASSAPEPLTIIEETTLPSRELFDLDIVPDYDATSSSADAIKIMLAMSEPQTSTPARQEYVPSDPLASGSQEPDMDDMEREWVN